MIEHYASWPIQNPAPILLTFHWYLILWLNSVSRKENDGGGEFNYDNIVKTFVNVTMCPQYKNNFKKT
jgi:hypothetical protein